MRLFHAGSMGGLLLVISSFVGCSEPKVTGDKSNMPPDIRAEEEKFEADHAGKSPVAGKK